LVLSILLIRYPSDVRVTLYRVGYRTIVRNDYVIEGNTVFVGIINIIDTLP
jgi:hypothetical protein